MESGQRISQGSESINDYGPNGKSKKKDTLTRKDVMQKTLFRALRKEYNRFFHKFIQFKGYNLNYDTKIFRQYLNDFVDYIMLWETPEGILHHYGEFKHLAFIIGILVDYPKAKKMNVTEEEKVMIEKIYDPLYKYSHSKFDEILKIPETKFLFHKLCDVDYIDIFISNHVALFKQPEDYKRCAASIIALIKSRRVED